MNKKGAAMDKSKIDRINYLARKAREEELTVEEKEEQERLRNEYRQHMKNSYLQNTYIVDENGNKRKLIKD